MKQGLQITEQTYCKLFNSFSSSLKFHCLLSPYFCHRMIKYKSYLFEYFFTHYFIFLLGSFLLFIFSMQNISNTKLKGSGVPTRKLLDIKAQTIIKQLELAGMLSKDEFQFIIQSSISVLKFQPNILKTNSPAIIVGDIHGQFFDLLTIFRRHGLPPQTKYVFLGDYVDRGEFSIEVITLLFWLKLKYPKSIYLLRGNHECRVLTNTHNFKNECKSKYNIKIYELVIILFEVLPICCIVDGKYFCVHAGISPNVNSLYSEQIQKISRFCQIPEKGVLCDLLWSDPTDEDKKQWAFNSMRSCSYFYSREHALNFMKKNNLEMIIRGHQVQLEGYKYLQFKKTNKKNVLTIFSAPNYCDKYNNLGAVAIIQNSDITLHAFKHVQHPYVLPNNMNIFEWSIGIISGQAVKILIQLVKCRLMSQNNNEGTLDEIKQKLELRSKMEEIKKALEQKQIEHKQLCKPKQAIYMPDQNLGLDPKKCLVMILMFLCQKKQDQKDEAMPILNKEALQKIKEQENRINDLCLQQKEQQVETARQRKKTMEHSNISAMSEVSYEAREYKQQREQKQNRDFEHFHQADLNISSVRSSSSVSGLISNMTENSKECACTFGPKIMAFTKICPKKK